MADERLERLRQRFLETLSVEDEAQWIRERLRVGELERRRAETAATLGHAASRLALDSKGKATKKLKATFHVLAQLSMESLLRATVLLLRSTRGLEPREERCLKSALDELEGWLVAPTDAKKEAALRAIALYPGEADLRFGVSPGMALEQIASWLEGAGHERSRFLMLPFHSAPRRFLREVRDHLVPWLLGYADPLATKIGESPN